DKNPTGYPQVFDELNGTGAVTRTYTYGQRHHDNLRLRQRWPHDQPNRRPWSRNELHLRRTGNLLSTSGVQGNFTYTYDNAGKPGLDGRRQQQHDAVCYLYSFIPDAIDIKLPPSGIYRNAAPEPAAVRD